MGNIFMKFAWREELFDIKDLNDSGKIYKVSLTCSLHFNEI